MPDYQRLSEWARENGKSYQAAWRAFGDKKIPGAYRAENGQIYVPLKEQPKIQITKSQVELGVPQSTALSTASSGTRTNRSSLIDPLARFANLTEAFTPFPWGTGAVNFSQLHIRDIVILCQKAYYCFSPVRLIIDTITEFSASPIYFTGNNEKAIKFFNSFFRSINFSDFVEQFFLEFYRSGNCFVYRQDSNWSTDDISNLNKALGTAAKNVVLPARYIVLNPAEVQITGASSFIDVPYVKTLSDYELARLRNPKTEQDQKILESLPPETQAQIKEKFVRFVTIVLTHDKLTAVFNKKMLYEPFAVPPIFPILDDLEHKIELKKMDRAVMRTIQMAVLHIKCGYENKNGDYMFDQKVADSLNAIFQNESVSRVLVTDFTTEVKYVIPEIAEILDPKKYEVVNGDIKESLNNILFGASSGDTFSNTQTKVRVFLEKIRRARQTFLNNFLVPEIKRVCRIMGFKNYPIPHFQDIDIDDPVEFGRMVTRLAELGLLTAAETVEAIKSGRLPTPDESLAAQAEYRKAKDKGYYEPIIGGPFSKEKIAEMGAQNQMDMQQQKLSMPAGRPKNSKAPKKSSTVGYSIAALNETFQAFGTLHKKVFETLKKNHKIKELNKLQTEIGEEIVEAIMANEDKEKWGDEKIIKAYIADPTDKNKERVEKLEEVKMKHGVDNFVGCLLFNSQVKEECHDSE